MIISKEAEFTLLNYFKHCRPKKVEASDFKKVMLSELNFFERIGFNSFRAIVLKTVK